MTECRGWKCERNEDSLSERECRMQKCVRCFCLYSMGALCRVKICPESTQWLDGEIPQNCCAAISGLCYTLICIDAIRTAGGEGEIYEPLYSDLVCVYLCGKPCAGGNFGGRACASDRIFPGTYPGCVSKEHRKAAVPIYAGAQDCQCRPGASGHGQDNP